MGAEAAAKKAERRAGTLSCLVLDLDETLVSTRQSESDRLKTKERLEERGEGHRYYEFTIEGQRFWGVKRAYYEYFLDWAFATFDVVGVWTAAESGYADKVVRVLFGEHVPAFLWSREDCTKSRGLYYKQIAKLFDAFPALDPLNTVHVDDRRDVATYNYKVLLEVPSYDYPDPLTYDRTLVVVVAFLRDALQEKKTSLVDLDKTNVGW
jgi:TFIIF-interacting CTD phosphatase-like protein